MANDFSREPMLDMFIFETLQLVEQLEQLVLNSETASGLETSINEIFRIMHTIKGSAAMMMFNNISSLAHSIEDVFYFIRENKPKEINYSKLTDMVLSSIDFIKNEVSKIENGNASDGNATELITGNKAFLEPLKAKSAKADILKPETTETETNQKFYVSSCKPTLKNKYKAVIFFEDGCEMENIRAFSILHNLKDKAEEIEYLPKDIVDNSDSIEIIRKEGFKILFRSELSFEDLEDFFLQTIFLSELKLKPASEEEVLSQPLRKKEISLLDSSEENTDMQQGQIVEKDSTMISSKQNYISVNISKMDKLMDLVGELVISEAMVTQNPDLKGLVLDNFNKSARQLKKITDELQDIVMSVRMVPLSMTFQKMNRIVRDMSKKLNKEVQLEIIGEETEVDKNIIEHISDPLMHLIRNSLDHGIEPLEKRRTKGKPDIGRITLEAKSSGGDVWIIIKDDGKGLDKEKILKKARTQGLIHKPESELTDKEIYSFILLPGFSTKESVTEFSGRGVGMDVVTKNIESVGGSIIIDSIPDVGSTVSIKIPLTLAIVDGMIISVGKSVYTVPTTSIKESFRLRDEDIIKDTENNEMVFIRGECFPLLRINEAFKVKDSVTKISEGIIMMVENESKGLCLFTDELLGEQQVVVKALPKYIKKVKGIAGCTLLGDGNISLILDIAGLIN